MSAPVPDRRPTTRPRHLRLGDLRLWAGIALMCGSVLIGARLLASDEDVVVVLQASRDLSTGTALATPDAVQPVAVPRALVGDRYVPADGLPEAARIAQPVRAGELVPVGALSLGADVDLRTVTVPVDPLHAPPGLLPGDRVDVWSSPKDAEAGKPTLVLSAASVHSVPGGDVGLGGEIGVVLSVSADEVGTVVAATRAGQVDLVAVPVDAQMSMDAQAPIDSQLPS